MKTAITILGLLLISIFNVKGQEEEFELEEERELDLVYYFNAITCNDKECIADYLEETMGYVPKSNGHIDNSGIWTTYKYERTNPEYGNKDALSIITLSSTGAVQSLAIGVSGANLFAEFRTLLASNYASVSSQKGDNQFIFTISGMQGWGSLEIKSGGIYTTPLCFISVYKPQN